MSGFPPSPIVASQTSGETLILPMETPDEFAHGGNASQHRFVALLNLAALEFQGEVAIFIKSSSFTLIFLPGLIIIVIIFFFIVQRLLDPICFSFMKSRGQTHYVNKVFSGSVKKMENFLTIDETKASNKQNTVLVGETDC